MLEELREAWVDAVKQTGGLKKPVQINTKGSVKLENNNSLSGTFKEDDGRKQIFKG